MKKRFMGWRWPGEELIYGRIALAIQQWPPLLLFYLPAFEVGCQCGSQCSS
jgi:hypothetical protein